MKAHVSSVGERRWPGAGGEATPGPGRGHGTEEPAAAGHIATLGDTSLGGGVTICGLVCAGLSRAGGCWVQVMQGWCGGAGGGQW